MHAIAKCIAVSVSPPYFLYSLLHDDHSYDYFLTLALFLILFLSTTPLSPFSLDTILPSIRGRLPF